MPSQEIEIRSYRSGDEKSIVNLLETVWGEWPLFDIQCSSLDHWKWKFLDNPLNLSAISVAEDNGEIIGCFHCTVNRVKIGKKTLKGCNASDVAVHSDYRGQRLSTKMKEAWTKIRLEKNISFAYGIESNPILIKKNIKSGIDQLFPQKTTMFVSINDVSKHLHYTNIKNNLIKSMGYSILKLFNSLNKISHLNYPDFDSFKIESFSEDINELYMNVSSQYDYIMVRDSEYLNWRYDSRGGNYIKWVARDKETLGYVVYIINRKDKDYPIGYIVDLIFKPDRLDVAYHLIDKALQYFLDNEINSVYSVVVNNSIMEKVMKKMGLLNSYKKLLLNYSPIEEIRESTNLIDTCSPKKMHFMYADFDWI